MATLVLVRHARSTSNGSGTLAGRTPGVELDETGRGQAAGLPGRLRGLPLHRVVASPLRRCGDTVRGVAAERGLRVVTDERWSEVDYGDWTGCRLAELTELPLWRVVQQQPAGAVFPGGEGLAAMQARAVAAARECDRSLESEVGEHGVAVVCSHGDVLKSVLADALGAHLDLFQRIVVEPASVSVVRYTASRPFVLRLNDTGGDLSGLAPQEGSSGGEATVGGDTGRAGGTSGA
ncbi:MSMEG_4193 family putative phosphomutase [Salinifilum aidingensis]